MKFVGRELRETAEISRGDQSPHQWARFAVTVIALLALGYLALGFAGERLALAISDDTEAEWFSASRALCETKSTKDAASDLERPRRILERLIAAPEIRKLPYCLFLADMDAPNAFALPGGAIGVTRPLLDGIESDVGLAMVIAHELGHHQHRHTTRRLGRTLLYQLALGFLFGSSGAHSLAESSLAAAESEYSRDQEREADDFGLGLVHETFGTTTGALEFFEWVARDFEGDAQEWAAWLSSHPLTKERIERLERRSRELDEASE